MNCPRGGQAVELYSADEGTNSYVPKERDKALEKAAKVAEEKFLDPAWNRDFNMATRAVALAIRALKGQP